MEKKIFKPLVLATLLFTGGCNSDSDRLPLNNTIDDADGTTKTTLSISNKQMIDDLRSRILKNNVPEEAQECARKIYKMNDELLEELGLLNTDFHLLIQAMAYTRKSIAADAELTLDQAGAFEDELLIIESLYTNLRLQGIMQNLDSDDLKKISELIQRSIASADYCEAVGTDNIDRF